MKTAKTQPADSSSSRRAQPPRQTRNNPPRSAVAGSRAFGPRGSLGGGDGGAAGPEQPIEIFPAITHFADAITALPKELVRHFTLLKEVDAKIFAPEEDLERVVHAIMNAPPPISSSAHGPASANMSAPGSMKGSTVQHDGANAVSHVEPDHTATSVYDPANMPRRQLFQQCAYTMQNMLVSLDEKNHVISTAAEALNKQLARIDDCFPYIELEVSEEARYGSLTHWAYPENRSTKPTGGSRKEPKVDSHLTAAAQQMVDEAAARSDARKAALLAKKGRNQPAESDFDDPHEGRSKPESRKAHGNSKVRKAADASTGPGAGSTNGTSGNPPQKRRKVDKSATGGHGMERALSGVFGSNGAAAKNKVASPRDTPGLTPVPDGTKKKPRGGAAANGQSRKRNNTVTSRMSPSLASSPIRTTFPESKLTGRGSPAPANGGPRPASSRARQNSINSVLDTAVKRPGSSASNRPNGAIPGTPDLGAAATAGKSIIELKASLKESLIANGETVAEEAEPPKPDVVSAVEIGSRKDGAAPEEPESNGPGTQSVQMAITTKSGRASKPSTPAITSFPEPVRSRPSRAVETSALNSKRSHKKGAGAAAQLIAQQTSEVEDAASDVPGEEEDGENEGDEPTYCYCNGVSYGEMVGCDNDDCEKEWFHLECVGLKVAPRGNAKWYCDGCKDSMKTKRFNGR